jgi:hypothetical protein
MDAGARAPILHFGDVHGHIFVLDEADKRTRPAAISLGQVAHFIRHATRAVATTYNKAALVRSGWVRCPSALQAAFTAAPWSNAGKSEA